MTNAFGVVLDSASVRRAAVEGVSETVITAIYLLHERSIDEIVAKLRPGELEQGLQALIPEKRHGSPWSLRHAAWTVLLVATTGFSAVLADCSGLATYNGEVPATGPDLSYREVIASHLKKTFKNYSTYDSFEIFDARWVHSMKGWNWLTCVRFQDHGHLRIYAVFLNGEKIIDDRYAVQTDNCDLQTYAPFERSSSGLDPLH